LKQVTFRTSRSGGKGGQHVNKVETKVELLFDINACSLLNAQQKQLIFSRLQNKIDNDGQLHIVSQTERSQLLNREKVSALFIQQLKKALAPVKIRRATQPSKQSKQQRIEQKRKHSEKKSHRRFNPRNHF
jgi:ribosome-associated protein